jgi:hypothetical protein
MKKIEVQYYDQTAKLRTGGRAQDGKLARVSVNGIMAARGNVAAWGETRSDALTRLLRREEIEATPARTAVTPVRSAVTPARTAVTPARPAAARTPRS